MGNKTEIEWADATVNFAWGCTKVSPGCENCYMFRLSKMFGKSSSFSPRKIEYVKRDIAKLPEEAIIFTNSMTDTYHEDASDDTIKEWFDIMASHPNKQWIILTKRINRAYNFHKKYPVPKNCWIGTSVESRGQIHRIRKLKLIDAPIRFISFEPLLESMGKLDLRDIDWAIVGGESDQAAPRPFEESWAVSLMEQCRKYGVSFFYKQSGGKKKNKIGPHSVWGTNYLNGKQYLEMPHKYLLKTKPSQERLVIK